MRKIPINFMFVWVDFWAEADALATKARMMQMAAPTRRQAVKIKPIGAEGILSHSA
jgi:hypothetical protein